MSSIEAPVFSACFLAQLHVLQSTVMFHLRMSGQRHKSFLRYSHVVRVLNIVPLVHSRYSTNGVIIRVRDYSITTLSIQLFAQD